MPNATPVQNPTRMIRQAAMLASIVVAFWIVAATASAASLTASLDRDEATLGEVVALSLVFEGVRLPGAPILTNLHGFRVDPRPNHSRQSIRINGQENVKEIFTYRLAPTQVGELTIRPIEVAVGNEVLTAEALKLKVVPEDTTAPKAAPNQWAFLRMIVTKTNAYIGEPLPIRTQLYFRDNENAEAVPQLKADGFSLGKPAAVMQKTTQVGGMPFRLNTYRSSVSAARVGTVILGPAETRVWIIYQRDFFGRAVRYDQATIQSESYPINVLPLPAANVPPTFAGAVGDFTLQVTAGPNAVAVGDPITVRIQVSGQGPIESLTLPIQPQWTNDFSLYPPTSTTTLSDALGLSGAKVFTNVLIPLNHEIKELPPFQFSFFDPNAGAYRTLSGPTIPLTVKPSATVATMPPATTNTPSARGEAPPANDILHIKARLDQLDVERPPLLQQAWFLGLQGVPVLAWAALLLRRKRGEWLASNPRLRRQREAAQRVREGLKALHAAAAGNHSDVFFAALFRVLQEQLGERLDLPASAITEAVIEEHLRPRQLPEETLKALHELFQTCNLARYAPLKSSQELAAIIPHLETVLRELQRMKG